MKAVAVVLRRLTDDQRLEHIGSSHGMLAMLVGGRHIINSLYMLSLARVLHGAHKPFSARIEEVLRQGLFMLFAPHLSLLILCRRESRRFTEADYP